MRNSAANPKVGRADWTEAAADLAIRTVDDGYASFLNELCGVQCLARPTAVAAGEKSVEIAPFANQTLQRKAGGRSLVFQIRKQLQRMGPMAATRRRTPTSSLRGVFVITHMAG